MKAWTGFRAALGASLCVHAVVLAWRTPAPPPRDAIARALIVPIPPPMAPPSVALIATPPPTPPDPAHATPGAPVPTVAGPGDFVTLLPSSPLPRAEVDRSAPTEASPGGGQPGAAPSDSGRRDRDLEQTRAQPWNDPKAYALPRRGRARTPATPEPILRVPQPTVSASLEPHLVRARDGEPEARPAQGTPGEGIAERPIEPAIPREVPGGAGGPTGAPLTEVGLAATEAAARGPLADDTAARQASDERTPIPLEQNRPSAGGDAVGVAGPAAADGPSRIGAGQGAGASTLALPRAPGRPSTTARTPDPWVRDVIARVSDRVTYPPELAVRLEQGLVVVIFRVDRSGKLGDVRLARSSGFRAFDDEVLAAVRRAAPFRPVPAALLAGRGAIEVRAPFEFENPVIR